MEKRYDRAFAAILVFAAAYRLINAGAPLLGIPEWRQCDTAAIARNFYSEGMNPFYPRIDWGGAGPGFVETEFQLYPFIVACLYAVFGPDDRIGRLVSIMASLAGLYYFRTLTERYFGRGAALWGSFLVAVLPLSAFYSSSFQPESAVMALSLAGLHYIAAWTEGGKGPDLAASAAAMSLACLMKPTTMHLAIPVLAAMYSVHGISFLSKWRTWAYAAAIFVPLALWHAHAYSLFLQYSNTFGIIGGPKSKLFAADFLRADFWKQTLLFSVIIKHFAVLAFPLFIAGACKRSFRNGDVIFGPWLLSFAVYFIAAARGHYLLEYYQLPLAFIGCAFAGAALDELHRRSPRGSLATAGAIAALSVVIYSQYIILQSPKLSETARLAAKAGKMVPAGSLTVHISAAETNPNFPGSDPTFFYHAGLKGWVTAADAVDEKFVEDKIKAGAKYVTAVRSAFAGREDRLEKLRAAGLAVLSDDADGIILGPAKAR